jgi:DNA segregation ATPase FtsK/SpoIIIE-like protein
MATEQAQRDVQKRRLAHQLEVQSLQIEKVMEHHDVPGRVSGGAVRPRSIIFELQTHLAHGWESLRALTDDLMRALGARDVQWQRDNGRWRLSINRADDAPAPLLELLSLVGEPAPGTAVLGLSQSEQPVQLNFRHPATPHALVTGASGAGKTALLRSIALSLALTHRQSQLQLLALQPPGLAPQRSLAPLNHLPHLLAPVISETETVRETMAFLAEEAAYRRQEKVTRPSIVVLIDHAAVLAEMSGPAFEENLLAVAQRGAEAGVHLVVAAAHPAQPPFSPLLTSNLPLRLVGQTADEATALSASGLADSGAAYLLGEGDFLAVQHETVTRFQAAYVDAYDLHMCIVDLHRRRPPILLAQPFSERPSLPQPPVSGAFSPPQNDELWEEESW